MFFQISGIKKKTSAPLRSRKGFTLVELIVVIVIILVLSAVMVPSILKWINQSKRAKSLEEAAMAVRMAQILMADVYMENDMDELELSLIRQQAGIPGNVLDCSLGVDESAFDLVHLTYQNDWHTIVYCRSYLSCSENGHDELYNFMENIPAPPDSGNGEEHPDGSGDSSSPSQGTLPFAPDLSLQKSYWPSQEDFADNPYGSILVPAGGVFQYSDGNYYVVNKDTSITQSQAASGPGGEVHGWYNTQKLTGNVVSFTGGEQLSSLQRGDLTKVGDRWYVFIDGGSYGYSPAHSPNQWYEVPH